jgi:hypothetical protein
VSCARVSAGNARKALRVMSLIVERVDFRGKTACETKVRTEDR